MSYRTRITGRIDIVPPVSARVFKGSFEDIRVVMEERPVLGVPDAFQRVAIGIESSFDGEPLSPYHLEQNLRDLAALIQGHGSECVGWLVLEGREKGVDVSRISIAPDGTLITEQAILTWPDGTKVRL